MFPNERRWNHKNKTELLSAVAAVQLGADSVVWWLCELSMDAVGQLEWDINRCSWFSLQCYQSVNSSDTEQLAVFIRMVFDEKHHQGT